MNELKIKKEKKFKWWYVLIMVVGAIGFIAFMGSMEGKETGDDKTTAYVMSQQFVEDRLKAPSTAKFPLSVDADISQNESTKVWTITSFVDSQNSFGAMIRSYYTAELKYSGNDKWQLLNLKIK